MYLGPSTYHQHNLMMYILLTRLCIIHFLNQVCTGRHMPGSQIAFVCEVGMHACICVCVPQGILILVALYGR